MSSTAKLLRAKRLNRRHLKAMIGICKEASGDLKNWDSARARLLHHHDTHKGRHRAWCDRIRPRSTRTRFTMSPVPVYGSNC